MKKFIDLSKIFMINNRVYSCSCMFALWDTDGHYEYYFENTIKIQPLLGMRMKEVFVQLKSTMLRLKTC
jgi:hypothetical protein